MTSDEKVAPVVEALAKLGVVVGEAHKAALVSMVENVADADAKTMMDAFASNLVEHGIAGAFQNAERADITSSEGAAIAMINSNIEGGADALIAWAKAATGQT